MRHAEADDAQRSRGKAFARASLAGAAAGVLLILAGGTAAAASTLSGHQSQTQQTQVQPTQSTAPTSGTAPAKGTTPTQGTTPIKGTTPTQSTASDATPAAPSGVSAAATDGQVALSWSAVTGATSYAVFAATSESFAASIRKLTVSGPGGTVTGLTNGTTYYFWVIAVNSAGQSSVSVAVKATPVATVTAPGAPVGVKATSRDDGATVTWAVPASDGGSPVTGYDVYASTSPDFRGGMPAAKVTGTSYVLSGQPEGDMWYFKVAAVNARGMGPVSAVASAFVGLATPVTLGAPTSVAARPGLGRVTLTWTAPHAAGTAISGYFVFAGTSPGGESATPVSKVLVHGTSVVVAGLAGGSRYYFTVAAVGKDGRQGERSAEVTAVPLGPVGPRQTSGTGQTSSTGQTSGTSQSAGTGQTTGTGQADSIPPGTIQVADQDGSPTGTGSQPATTNHRSPHAVAIIALSGVATAALAGAVGAALHLRRRRRLSTPPASPSDRRPLDSMSGRH